MKVYGCVCNVMYTKNKQTNKQTNIEADTSTTTNNQTTTLKHTSFAVVRLTKKHSGHHRTKKKNKD